jgi:predicted phosphodiesterase
MVRFAAISDIHHFPHARLPPAIAFWKLSEHALSSVREFKSSLAHGGFKFGINLGDSVEDDSGVDSASIDGQNISEVVNALENDLPIYYAIGNHDTVNNSPDTLSRITGCKPYYSFNEGAFHFIVLHSVADASNPENTLIPETQLNWLKSDLQENRSRPTVVFLHHALSERSVAGNHWFEPNPKQAFVKNRAEVRDIFKESGNVCLVMNGHLHDNNVWQDEADQTLYITLQSATENIGNNTPANAWADVQLAKEGVSMRVLGNDPRTYEYEFPARIQNIFPASQLPSDTKTRAA